MCLNRRDFLRAAVAATGGLALASSVPVRRARAQSSRGDEQVVLETTVVGAGTYVYLPFDVPRGTNRVHVLMEQSTDESIGLGCFDERGPAYQSPGFRGVYGEERKEFFVEADRASQSFLPGPIRAGEWTIVVPVFEVKQPTDLTITITMSKGPQPAAFEPGPGPGVVRDAPGWYRGDLHAHTPHSSDAWNTGTALAPADWAQTARDIGLDFVALTDHNTVSQNLHLARDAGDGVLLMAGEEMTNWFHGHATVSGVEPVDAWLDWRQRPQGIPLQEYERRITAFLSAAQETGAYVAAAHPFLAHLSWQFFADARANPEALPRGIEVWTGQYTPFSEEAVTYWDELLNEGFRITANGGTDLHGTENDMNTVPGTPTNVVYAQDLSRDGIVSALHAGRAFVTRLADGVEIYLSAEGPDAQHQPVGGTIYGETNDVAHVTALVRRGAGARFLLIANGQEVFAAPVTDDEQTFTADVPIGPGGYVRAEVRGLSELRPGEPLGSRYDMEALTNPIFLVNGREPEDNEPQFAPPSGQQDEGGDDGTDGRRRGQPRAAPDGRSGGRALPSTGGGAAAAGAALAAGGAALSRRLRASDVRDDDGDA